MSKDFAVPRHDGWMLSIHMFAIGCQVTFAVLLSSTTNTYMSVGFFYEGASVLTATWHRPISPCNLVFD